MFSDLLNETKGFKYQITLKVMLKKYKPNMEKLNLDQFISIQQQKQWQIMESILKMLFKKFCTGLIIGLMKDLVFIVELIESQYIKISSYRPLSGSSYVKLPVELRN